MTDDSLPSDDELVTPEPLAATEEPVETAKPRPRRGSGKRKRQKVLTVRATDAEYLQIVAAAREAGLTIGSFCRSRTVAAPTTQPRRRAPVDVEALVRVQCELNRIATYLHELLRQGRLVKSEEVSAALQGYREAVAALMAALVTTFGSQLPAPEPGDCDEEAEEAA
jgi:hypothetical protein